MSGRICIFSDSLPSLCQGHCSEGGISFFQGKSNFGGKSLITAQLSRIEQRRFVRVFIAQHCVHALSRNLIVTNFNIFVIVLTIHCLKAAKIFHQDLTISLLMSGIFVIIAGHTLLTGLHHRVRFVTIGFESGVASYIINHFIRIYYNLN